MLVYTVFIGPKPLLFGQIQVDQSNNLELLPERLIRNVFIGQGVKIESVRYLGANNGLGVFRNGTNDIGLDRGIVISTGAVETLAMSNNDAATGSSTSSRTVKDDELAAVAGRDLFDVAVIEIQFRPNDDLIGFNFVFGSEEYPEYVCSQFNDVFAFFINGPNPDGGNYVSHNIARVPDPSDPTGNTLTDFPVTINSVNHGQIGDEAPGDCTGDGESLGFSQYFNNNDLRRTFTLDGYLDVFKARTRVVPCELYTLRLAIGDGFDDAFDSAVFLEAKSFSSALHTIKVDAPGADYSMMEGCDPTIVEVTRIDGSVDEIEIDYSIISGPNNAVRGEDYTLNTNQLVIPAGQQSSRLIINPLEDDLDEDQEYIYIVFRNSDCFQDTLKVELLDHKDPEFSVPNDTMLCEGEQIILESGDAKQLNVAEKSGNFAIGDTLRGDCRSTINVSNLDVQYLNEESFVQICIDMLEHQMLSDLEIYLASPSGHLVELSTNNGEDGGNGSGMDQMINTCFTLGASNLINGGDQMEGPFLSSNPTYTGNFAPEQDISALFEGFYFPVNGQWTLIIRDNENPGFTGTLYQWSLKFNPKYQETKTYTINGDEVFSSPISVTSNSVIREEIDQNFGCTYSNSSEVLFTPLPETPTVMCSNPRRNQILLDWDDMDVDEYEIKRGSGAWQVISASESLIDNLSLDGDYNFEIRAVKNGCLGPSELLSCSTPPCADSKIIVESMIATSSSCTDDGGITLSLDSEDGPFRFQIGRETSVDGSFINQSKGRVRVFAFDVYGCTFQKIIEIEGPEPVSLELNAKKVSCDEAIRGSASVNITGGTAPFSYQWSNGETGPSISQVEKGIYSVIVRDINGCSASSEIEIVEGDIPVVEFTQENANCKGESTGAIFLTTMGGDGPYEYRWEDGFASVLPERKNLAAGTYTVRVEDRNQCYALQEITITEPDEFSISIDKEDNQCFNTAEGEARISVAGGTAPFSAFWSNGSTQNAIGGLRSGIYSVTVTDAGGCSAEQSVEIIEPAENSIEFIETPITCFEGQDGSIQVRTSVAGDYDYEWDNGRSFQTINNLSRGRYCVTITDDKGCTISDCYIIDQPESMSLSIAPTHITCYQSPDGALQFEIGGGQAPYSVELNGVSTTLAAGGMVRDLRSGVYFVKIIDATGCSITETVEIREASEPSIALEVKHLECSGETNGSIFLRYLNDPNAEISWTDEANNRYTGRHLIELASGDYHYEIQTSIGCILTGTIAVKEPENPLTLEIIKQDIGCFGDRNGLIQLIGGGGSDRYLYSLNGEGFQRSGIYSGLSSGTYTTFIKDDNGCELTGEDITIVEPEALKVMLPLDTIINSGVDLPVPVNVEGGHGEVMYQWTIEPDQDLTCPDCTDQFVNNVDDDFVLRVDVEDDNMCTDFDEMRVFVLRDYQMYVPTGFSPNGDAQNELLNVFGPDFAFIKEFNVFLRNGTNIYNLYNFEPNNMLKGWDGTFKGTLMPAGVYIWTMHVEYEDGARESFKGSVQLIR